jgi:epoxide hydrolase-like predicted phosphatase
VSEPIPVRAVISDFGGVLTSPLFESFTAWQRQSGLSFERLGQAMADAAERSGIHPLYELEKGTLTEAEFLRMLEAELDPGTSLSGMRDVYFEHLHPNPPMIELMRGLRGRGLRMALLTNNVREWEPQWRAKLPEIDEIFEVVVDSAFVGMRKPDRAIYELTLERLGGVRAEECLFVDDVDVNCETARSLGMRAVHYLDADQAVREIRAQT